MVSYRTNFNLSPAERQTFLLAPRNLNSKEREVFQAAANVLDLQADQDLGVALEVEEVATGRFLQVERQGAGLKISYSHLSALGRAFSYVREVWATGQAVYELCVTEKLAFWLDLSQGAVLRASTLQGLFNQLLVMGYDQVFLYLPQSYELPGEPYFSYPGARYDLESIRAFEDLALTLGLEFIPAIELGANLTEHFSEPCRATFGQLSFTEQATAIFAHFDQCLEAKVLHVGDLSQLAPEEVEQVYALAIQYGFKLYTTYNEAQVTEPASQVIYTFATIDEIAEFPQQEQAASYYLAGSLGLEQGIKPNYGRALHLWSELIPLCERLKSPGLLAQAYYVDHAEALYLEVLPSLQYVAEAAYSMVRYGLPSRKRVLQRLETSTGLYAEAFYKFRLFDEVPGVEQDNPLGLNPSKYILWSDPLNAYFTSHLDSWLPELISHYQELASYYDEYAELAQDETRLFFLQAAQLADCLWRKLYFEEQLRAAYELDDQAALRYLVELDLPELIAAYEDLQAFSLSLWYFYNRAMGSSILDQRFACVIARLKTAQDRVEGYLSGVYDSLPELEVQRLPYNGKSRQELARSPYFRVATFQEIMLAKAK